MSKTRTMTKEDDGYNNKRDKCMIKKGGYDLFQMKQKYCYYYLFYY